jgi:hypothetical protein
MHWVLSKNLKGDSAFPVLLTQLERQSAPFTLVGVVPFSGDVHEVDGDVRLEDITGPVFTCGKGSMKHVARRHNWTPGYIEAPDYVECLNALGDMMLNHDSVIGKLSEVKPIESRFFIRPVADDKSFNGQIMDVAEFLDWQKTMTKMEDSSTISKDDLIVLAPLREIYAEYRFYVVNGIVVTGSLYKSRDTVVYVECIDERISDFAQSMASCFNPLRTMVLDIADTPYGLKVLEANSISSSGFYAIDLGKFVNAINEMEY